MKSAADMRDEIPATVKKKHRRPRRVKRSPNVKRYYFDQNTQRAIELYQSSDDASERERLYVEKILPAFDQLVENLICIYKFSGLYDTHEALKNDCITFLYETLHKFDPTRGTKAFSYFNVVAKNWLIVRSKKRVTVMKRMVSLDAVDDYGRTGHSQVVGEQSLQHISDRTLGRGTIAINDAIADQFMDDAHDVVMLIEERSKQLKRLLAEIRIQLTNENEIRCIDAITSLFERADDLPLYKKRAVFTYIRDMSDLTPKQLTMALTVIKRHFNALKTDDVVGIF